MRCVQLGLQVFPEIKRLVRHKKTIKELIEDCCQKLDDAQEILNSLDDSRNIPTSLEQILHDLCSYRDILLEYQEFNSYRDIREREDELKRILNYIIDLVNNLRVLTGVMEYVSEIFDAMREVTVIHTTANYRGRSSSRRNSESFAPRSFSYPSLANDQLISMYPAGMMREEFQMIEENFSFTYHIRDLCLWMGNRCREGFGIKKGYKQSFKFYKYASNLQNPSGHLNAGWCYAHGVGVRQDYKKALTCYEDGAKLGEPRSIFNLAEMYVNGIGVKYNPRKALRLLDKVTSLEDSDLRNIDIQQVKFLKAQIHLRHLDDGTNTHNESIGFYMLKDLEQSCNPDVLNELGVCYCQGRGVNANLKRSYEYFKSAADANSFWGVVNLSIACLYGLGTTISEKDSRCYLEKARKHKGRTSVGIKMLKPEVLKWGSDGIGYMYENGIGVHQDMFKAVKFYESAAKYGNVEGILHIARLFETGKGVRKNVDVSLKYYLEAAKANCPFAQSKVNQIDVHSFYETS